MRPMRGHRRRSRRARFGRTVIAAALCASGLVLAAAFVGISVQANALDREKAALQADIDAAQARHAMLSEQIERQMTPDYVREKARDFGYIGPDEDLIAIERNEQAGEAIVRGVNEGSARLGRWIAFFFGSR